jgi:hypothetical protein
MPEILRRRLRGLMEKKKRPLTFSNFLDKIGEGEAIELPGFVVPGSSERFRAKVRAFLKDHEHHLIIHKLRTNQPLTPAECPSCSASWPRSAARRSFTLPSGAEPRAVCSFPGRAGAGGRKGRPVRVPVPEDLEGESD